MYSHKRQSYTKPVIELTNVESVKIIAASVFMSDNNDFDMNPDTNPLEGGVAD